MKLTPAAAARSMMANEVRSSHWCPNVIVPRQISDTFNPVLPSRRIFISIKSHGLPFRQCSDHVGWVESSRPTARRLVGLEDSTHPTPQSHELGAPAGPTGRRLIERHQPGTPVRL